MERNEQKLCVVFEKRRKCLVTAAHTKYTHWIIHCLTAMPCTHTHTPKSRAIKSSSCARCDAIIWFGRETVSRLSCIWMMTDVWTAIELWIRIWRMFLFSLESMAFENHSFFSPCCGRRTESTFLQMASEDSIAFTLPFRSQAPDENIIAGHGSNQNNPRFV